MSLTFEHTWASTGSTDTVTVPSPGVGTDTYFVGYMFSDVIGGVPGELVVPSASRLEGSFVVNSDGDVEAGTTIVFTLTPYGAGALAPDPGDIEWGDVVAFVATMANVTAAAQVDILAWVNDAFNADLLGGEDSARLRLMRIYLAAHLGTLGLLGGSGASGPVTSESAGGLSRSYAQLSSGAGLDSTTYGQMLALLIRTSAARGPHLL